MVNLAINLNGLILKNPVILASGTAGYGYEYDDFIDVNQLGGVSVKGTTLHNRAGNAYPRMAETPKGMLNAVGLQNKGIDYFIENIYPRLQEYDTTMILNASGSTIDDYVALCEKANELEHIPAIELNVSCPNVKEGGMAFGVSCAGVSEVVKEVRKVYHKHLMVKLSPNVTDIVEIAKAAEAEGADSLSLINTLLGMAINAETQRPVLSTITGGLSGPAIKPVALRMVWQVSNAVNIPIVGMGGIMNTTDAIEFFLAGASAIQIGTANFINPQVSIEIINGIEDYLKKYNYTDIQQIIGKLKTT
ncbi:dihydroorotate dehydrogenase (NAD+) catalytic subunit [Balneicella halophila]|uniref:Dihydroorotate dehydrogenase n=1 Tax=Balneicella halophila TaxID=1537566 RepID=A0A7L4UT07_BALHA|nr:dihydroorotate dehydrogenase [Balneicella halophila]PVX52631.1 dihydroorotate dehydrogenase (NAD+) catalytic subunit [Balneicella halophila]